MLPDYLFVGPIQRLCCADAMLQGMRTIQLHAARIKHVSWPLNYFFYLNPAGVGLRQQFSGSGNQTHVYPVGAYMWRLISQANHHLIF